jgi:hypothetical protein
VIDLLTKAKQRQQDEYEADPEGTTDSVLGASAIRYGLTELSKRKRDTLLRAELPHLWPYIEKLRGQKTEFSERALRGLIGSRAEGVIPDLVSIGLLERADQNYKIPFLFREGLELTQGRVD